MKALQSLYSGFEMKCPRRKKFKRGIRQRASPDRGWVMPGGASAFVPGWVWAFESKGAMGIKWMQYEAYPTFAVLVPIPGLLLTSTIPTGNDRRA